MRQTREAIQVWDPLVRAFHWLLVACVGVAYVFEDEFIRLHLLVGSVIAGLLAFRIVWGFVGARHARFADFWPSPADVRAHLRALVRLRSSAHVGHTPVGGVMIFLLLACLMTMAVTGVALHGLEGGGGLPAVVAYVMPRGWDIPVREVHESVADLLVLLALVHVGGVILESLLQRENLVAAMITGCKRVPKEEA